MPDAESVEFPWDGSPAGAYVFAVAAGVQAEVADGHEDVAVLGVNGDPVAWAAVAITAEGFGGHGTLDEAAGSQDVGGGARAIQPVAGFAMSSAILIGRILDGVSSRYGAMHHCRSIGGSLRIAPMQMRWRAFVTLGSAVITGTTNRPAETQRGKQA